MGEPKEGNLERMQTVHKDKSVGMFATKVTGNMHAHCPTKEKQEYAIYM